MLGRVPVSVATALERAHVIGQFLRSRSSKPGVPSILLRPCRDMNSVRINHSASNCLAIAAHRHSPHGQGSLLTFEAASTKFFPLFVYFFFRQSSTRSPRHSSGMNETTHTNENKRSSRASPPTNAENSSAGAFKTAAVTTDESDGIIPARCNSVTQSLICRRSHYSFLRP